MHERFIARQPIFDHRLKVFAYELLFRNGPHNSFQPRKHASSSVIVGSTMLFDLQTLTGHAKAFINADQEALLRGAAKLLPADRIIVEVLENVCPTPEVVAACADLRSAGYVLALDDFVDHPKWEPLLDLARFLKVDFRLCDEEARHAIARRYFAKGPAIAGRKGRNASRTRPGAPPGLRVLSGLLFLQAFVGRSPRNPRQQTELRPTHRIRDLPRFRRCQDRGSVKARTSPGLQASALFRRWVSIVALVSMAEDKSHELIRTALTRAYFCEEISSGIGMSQQKPDLFLMGLLWVTDAILDMPMQAVLSKLPVSSDLRTALNGGANRFRDVYDTLLSYERADWNRLSALSCKIGAAEDRVPEWYLSAANRATDLPL